MSFETGRLSPVSAASAVCSAVESNQSRVGGNGVAFFDEDDVAGHDSARGNALPLAITDDVRLRRRHLAQGGDRSLRACLLNVAHDGVEQHNRKDRHRFIGQRRITFVEPQAGRDSRRDEQQNNEQILKLREELSSTQAPSFRRSVRSCRTCRAAPAPHHDSSLAAHPCPGQTALHRRSGDSLRFVGAQSGQCSSWFLLTICHAFLVQCPAALLNPVAGSLIRPMWRRCLPRFGTIAAARHGHRSQMR